MASDQSARRYQPRLLAQLVALIGFGVLQGSPAQAAGLQPLNLNLPANAAASAPGSAGLRNIDLDMSDKTPGWKTASSVFGSGLAVARPFGERGMALKLSTSVPRETRDSLRASGDPRSRRAINRPNAYLFVHKRW